LTYTIQFLKNIRTVRDIIILQHGIREKVEGNSCDSGELL